MQNFIIKKEVHSNDPDGLCDLLAHLSGLSKSRIKKAMSQGAAWIERPGKKMRRIRRATTSVHPGDIVALYYDESILSIEPPKPDCVKDLEHYSIWYKPAGLMSQGTRYGDHCTLLRQVEMAFKPKRPVFPVHRLDREVSGLIMVAHHRRAAAALSDLLRKGQINKHYQAWVRGDLSDYNISGIISLKLDNRPALTRFKLISYDVENNQSLVQIQIITGRRHQIRRHFDLIGHPVMGDPRYGIHNKNRTGLQLVAYGLVFTCPMGTGPKNIQIDSDKMP